MKIYMLPYTFKTVFSDKKLHSGIDVATIKTANAFIDMGHEVRIFTVVGEMDDIYNPCFYLTERPTDLPLYIQKNRGKIYERLFADINFYKPDVIFSSFEFGAIYSNFSELFPSIPVIYQNHMIPGAMNDIQNAQRLQELAKDKLSLLCVSDYHKFYLEKFYNRADIKKHMPSRFSVKYEEGGIRVAGILPPSYIEKEYVAVPHDGSVRHISAMNPEKKTFFLHQAAYDQHKTEVFTTSSYLGGKSDKIKSYAEKHLPLYKDRTFMDLSHSEIMDRLSSSICSFVGLSTYDTYTITSLESFTRGVPVILWVDKNMDHPALSMCNERMKEKFVHKARSKMDILEGIQRFSEYSMDDRQELASQAYLMNSQSAFSEKLMSVVNNVNRSNRTEYSIESLLF